MVDGARENKPACGEDESYLCSEVMCVMCLDRWVAIRPDGVLLKDLECKNCGPGYVIETGEVIDADN